MSDAPRTISGTLMLPAQGGRVRLASGTLTLADGRIESLREGDPEPKPDLGGDGTLILPGLVDAHIHLPQFDSIGIDGMTLLEWLDRVIFPAECRWDDMDHAGRMAGRVARSLLSHGTTSICAYASVHHASTMAAIEAIADAGLRAMVGQVLMDRNAPAELCRPARQLLAEAHSLTLWTRAIAKARTLAAGGRVEHAITPRFAISCTPELLAGAGERARHLGAPVQTHLAENRAECDLIRSLFGGRSYTAVYGDAGLLGPRTILAHGIWLDDPERAILASTGSVIAHCPTANTFLQSGDCRVAWLEAGGVPAVLGTDVAGGPDRSMVRVARAAIETSKRVHWADQRSPIISPAQAWWRITGGNAEALGWPDTGRLRKAAEADILVVKPDIPWRDTPDPLGTLLYAWDDRWLQTTLVGGRLHAPRVRAA